MEFIVFVETLSHIITVSNGINWNQKIHQTAMRRADSNKVNELPRRQNLTRLQSVPPKRHVQHLSSLIYVSPTMYLFLVSASMQA